jgi:hypothetical protein
MSYPVHLYLNADCRRCRPEIRHCAIAAIFTSARCRLLDLDASLIVVEHAGGYGIGLDYARDMIKPA